jgi:hypothetical protein
VPAKDRRHYTGDYQRRAKAVRDAAYADPLTTCWRCGYTLNEGPHRRVGERWQAGHVIDASMASPLLPEARSCNASAGNRRRTQLEREPRSMQWGE